MQNSSAISHLPLALTHTRTAVSPPRFLSPDFFSPDFCVGRIRERFHRPLHRSSAFHPYIFLVCHMVCKNTHQNLTMPANSQHRNTLLNLSQSTHLHTNATHQTPPFKNQTRTPTSQVAALDARRHDRAAGRARLSADGGAIRRSDCVHQVDSRRRRAVWHLQGKC
jgi:hypothetical protein